MKRLFLFIILFPFWLTSCTKNTSGDNNPSISLPVVTTSPVSSITLNSASGGGNVTSTGGSSISARGVCWGISPNPTLINGFTADGSGSGVFSSSISGLSPSTLYYVRAYATNSAGTAFGNELSFTTGTPVLTLPAISTAAVSGITSTTASCGGSVTSDGGANVVERGVCWSVSPGPSITGNHTIDGDGVGFFASTINGLQPVTTYYIRAYAKNSIGIAYGNETSFTTTPTDVYVAGIESTGAFYTAKIWKNGVGTTLSNGNQANANGLFVKNPNVYVVGWEGPVINVKLWRNGQGSGISTTHGSNGAAVYVAGNDVYIAGWESNGFVQVPKLWKNGIGTSYLIGNFSSGSLWSVFVKGTDVYACGFVSDNAHNYAVVWKNGVPEILSTATVGGASATCVFVSGDDVYVAGSEHLTSYAVPVLWKNGVRTVLSGGVNPGGAKSVFVTGTDVYVCGYENFGGPIQTARIWKNGTPSSLTDGTEDASASSIYVLGNDVYVAGYENNSLTLNSVAKFWKNGIATSLTDGTKSAAAYAVFIQ